MHPAPSWFGPLFLAWGVVFILPVLLLGARVGGWRRAGLLSLGLAVFWALIFVLSTRVGLPPAWISIPVVYIGGPLLIWRRWPAMKETLATLRSPTS